MNIEIEKEIVNALPSLYPLQDYEEEAIDTIIKAIPHWIPCSERLPDVQGCYLVTEQILGVSTVDIRYYNIDDDDQYWYGWKDYIVLAWMPLPDPWKG